MNRKSLYWQIPLLLFLIAGTFFIARQRLNETEAVAYQHNEGFVFGTVYSLNNFLDLRQNLG